MTENDTTVPDAETSRTVEERRFSPGITSIQFGLLVIVAFFGVGGAWAGLAPLDGAVVGAGALKVHGNSKTVQHKEGGIVDTLLVQEGERVARDQVLIHLDATQVSAMLRVHRAQLLGDEALCARVLAELSNEDSVVFPEDVDANEAVSASVRARERAVFGSHRSLLTQQMRVIDERIAQARRQAEGATAQHVAAMRGLAFGIQQLDALASLQRNGLAGRNTVLELSRSVEVLRGETGQLQSEVARHAAEEAELQAEKLRLRAVAQSDATRELRDAQLRINDVTPRIVADRDLIARLDIRAPVSGRVVDLQAFTKGGVIEPGRPIMQIVPDDRTIVATAEIRPEDVEHLHVGQAARVVATGFSTRDTPAIDGRIDVVSADRITDPRTGRSYYTAEISLGNDHEGGALIKRLEAGMPVEVVISVKPRTALEYLTEPLTTSFRAAGREM